MVETGHAWPNDGPLCVEFGPILAVGELVVGRHMSGPRDRRSATPSRPGDAAIHLARMLPNCDADLALPRVPRTAPFVGECALGPIQDCDLVRKSPNLRRVAPKLLSSCPTCVENLFRESRFCPKSTKFGQDVPTFVQHLSNLTQGWLRSGMLAEIVQFGSNPGQTWSNPGQS